MADTSNLTGFLEDIASAIKTKTNKEQSEKIPAADFDTEILGITTGKLTEEEYQKCNDLADAIAGQVYSNPYTKLEYIEGTGSQYTIANYIFTADTRIEMDCLVNPNTGNNYNVLFGSVYEGKEKNAMALFTRFKPNSISPVENIPVYNRTGQETFGSNFYYNKRILVTAYKKVCTWTDGTNSNQVTTNGTADNGISPMGIFTKVLYPNGQNEENPPKGKIYDIKFYENNDLKRHYIPVKNNDTNKIGLLDLFTNEFISSKSNTEFVAGPELTGGEG